MTCIQTVKCHHVRRQLTRTCNMARCAYKTLPACSKKLVLIIVLTYEVTHLLLSYNVIRNHHHKDTRALASKVTKEDILGVRNNTYRLLNGNHSRNNLNSLDYQFANTSNNSNGTRHRHKYDRFATNYVTYKSIIKDVCREEELRHQREGHGTADQRDGHGTAGLCPCFPPDLRIFELAKSLTDGHMVPDIPSLLELTWLEALSLTANTTPGGHWRPAHCAPRRRVAVIIPCRDRERHLRAFLAHTHAILQRQLLEYRVFVVEQELPYTFNKGAMMNIGYIEAMRDFRPHCILVHDVDLLMENDRHLVACGKYVQHMGAYVDKYNYHVKYYWLLGGAALMTAEVFRALNGYSNRYFGWGGEDDDFKSRLAWQNLTMFRAPRDIASYSMIKHDQDFANPVARDRRKFRAFSPKVYTKDGVSSVRYKVVRRVDYPLYTWIHAKLLKTPYSSRFFNNKRTKFKVLRARCLDRAQAAHNTTFTLSAVTCRQLCMERHQGQCVGILYYHSDITDSYCQLLHTMCNRTEPSSTEEIHIKHSYIK